MKMWSELQGLSKDYPRRIPPNMASMYMKTLSQTMIAWKPELTLILYLVTMGPQVEF